MALACDCFSGGVFYSGWWSKPSCSSRDESVLWEETPHFPGATLRQPHLLLDQRSGSRPRGVSLCLCKTSTSSLLRVCLSLRALASLSPEMGVGWWRCRLSRRPTLESTPCGVKPTASSGVQCLCRSGLWKVRNRFQSLHTHEPRQMKTCVLCDAPQVVPQHPGCYWPTSTLKICPLTSCVNQKDALNPGLNFQGKTNITFKMSVNTWRMIILWSL